MKNQNKKDGLQARFTDAEISNIVQFAHVLMRTHTRLMAEGKLEIVKGPNGESAVRLKEQPTPVRRKWARGKKT